MLKYLNYIIFILPLIISCAYRTPTPEWLNQQPVSSDFWYGIASVGKNMEDYRQKAMELATDQIAFQIRTHIQSTRQLTREEINLNFSETPFFIKQNFFFIFSLSPSNNRRIKINCRFFWKFFNSIYYLTYSL